MRTIKAPRFVRGLVEKWIEEYAKIEPGITFQIVKGSGSQENTDLNIVSGSQDNNTKDFSHIVYFGETAVLPITARSSEAARLLEGKHLNAKKLKQLFFLGGYALCPQPGRRSRQLPRQAHSRRRPRQTAMMQAKSVKSLFIIVSGQSINVLTGYKDTTFFGE
ncbi:MAG: hypothetical protein II826_07535 [Prevotella sp.]|nr:hypothetical protein [Prevotella sp.]